MSKAAFRALLTGLLLAAAPALAQTDGAPGDVVITAKPQAKPAEVKKQAQALSQMEDFYSEPLAQWQEPICPGVMGMKADLASIMVDRMRDIAGRAKIDTATDGACSPNILIIFVHDGQKDLKSMARKHSYLFGGISVQEMKDLAKAPGPIHAWNNTVVKGRYGDLIQGREEAGQLPVLQQPLADSHLVLSHRRDIVSSVVMIDIGAIDGMSAVQIADYAVMRSLARTRPVQGDPAATTILSLFDKGAPRPQEITTFDIAYLRSLYTGLAALPASAKIGAIPREIRKELAKQEAGQTQGQP